MFFDGLKFEALFIKLAEPTEAFPFEGEENCKQFDAVGDG